MKSYDIVIVGAGVTGCSIARELSRFRADICVLDQNSDVCEGTSKANSAIVHAGYDPVPGTLKAGLNVRGNEIMDQIALELDIPFKRIGALILSFGGTKELEELKKRGEENGVKGLRLLTREETLELEPNLGDGVTASLHVPASGVICPFELTMGMAENAAENGAEFLLGHKMESLRRVDGGFILHSCGEMIFTKTLVNAAGVYADSLHNLVCEDKIKITPRAGDYLLLDHEAAEHVSHTIFQLPNHLGKGILVSPTVHGNLLMGPTSTDIENKENTSTTAADFRKIEETAALSIKSLPVRRQLITSFAGIRAHMGDEDFLVGKSAESFYEAAGIESPGLTSAPAIGEMLAEMISADMKLPKKDSFNPIRHAVRKINELSAEERARAIEENPAYGAIVCRCEEISQGEILDAIRRPLGATTVDGVKRRTRAGMGRCQGGFCSPRVMELLAGELGVPMTELRKNNPGSKILSGESRKGAGE